MQFSPRLRRCARRAVSHLIVTTCVAALAAGSGSAQAPSGQDAPRKGGDPKHVVRFKHKDCGPKGATCRAAYNLALEDGEKFAIQIDSTLPDDFSYDVEGIPAAPGIAPEAPKWRDTTLYQVHDHKYGGYIVNIRKRAGTASLPDATLVIGVRTAEWSVAVAGGFPVSNLTDRQYSLRDTTVGGDAKYLVRRETDHEDKVALATATFIHLRRTGWRWPGTRADVGLSFGLGVASNTTYFVGPSLLFGSAGAFTVGAVFGSRADLPNGVNVNALTSNANALTNMARRNATGLFAGFSYSFLGNSSALEKPFKGTETAGQSGDSTGARGEANKDTSRVSVREASFSAGEGATFVIRLVKGDGGTADLEDGEYSVRPAGTADSALVEIPNKVTLKADSTKHAAEGQLKGRILKDPAGAVVHLVVNGKGYSKQLVTPPLASK